MSRLASALAIVASVVLSFAAGAASAAEYWFADQQAFPGCLWHAVDDNPERLVLRREPTANPAFPNAIMKVAQVAAAPDGAFYFVSGLDGCVIGLLDGRHEILSFEVDGQIRDIACGGEDHVVYFSVVPTPQDGEPLADGKIYRRDLWDGDAAEVATIHQADVGGNWWGTFTVRDGVIFIATTESQSRLFRLISAAPEPIYPDNNRSIYGLESNGDDFLIADDNGQIFRTRDFTAFDLIRSGAAKFSGVTVRQ